MSLSIQKDYVENVSPSTNVEILATPSSGVAPLNVSLRAVVTQSDNVIQKVYNDGSGLDIQKEYA